MVKRKFESDESSDGESSGSDGSKDQGQHNQGKENVKMILLIQNSVVALMKNRQPITIVQILLLILKLIPFPMKNHLLRKGSHDMMISKQMLT